MMVLHMESSITIYMMDRDREKPLCININTLLLPPLNSVMEEQ